MAAVAMPAAAAAFCCGGFGCYSGTAYMGMCTGSHWTVPATAHYGCYSSYGCMGPGYCGGGCYASAGYAPGWPSGSGSCYGYGGGLGGLSSFTCGGNYGCYGGYACYGVPTATEGSYVDPGMSVPSTMVPSAPMVPSITPAPAPMIAPPKAWLENKIRSRGVIDTPENAKLYVDGQLVRPLEPWRLPDPGTDPGQHLLLRRQD